MLIFLSIGHSRPNFSQTVSEIQIFHSTKYIWKYRLQFVGHFVADSIYELHFFCLHKPFSLNHCQTKWCTSVLSTILLASYSISHGSHSDVTVPMKHSWRNVNGKYQSITNPYINQKYKTKHNDMSTRDLVMASNHYLSRCSPKSLLPFGVAREQWVNNECTLFHVLWYHMNKHIQTIGMTYSAI